MLCEVSAECIFINLVYDPMPILRSFFNKSGFGFSLKLHMINLPSSSMDIISKLQDFLLSNYILTTGESCPSSQRNSELLQGYIILPWFPKLSILHTFTDPSSPPANR